MRIREIKDIPRLKEKEYYFCLFYSENDVREFTKNHPWFTEDYYDMLRYNEYLIIERNTKVEGCQVEIFEPRILRSEWAKDAEFKAALINSLNEFCQ